MMAGRPLCTFRLDAHDYGIDVARVQEVLLNLPVTSVPLAPPGLSGLVNLRGQVLSTIDLRARLELPPRPPGSRSVNLIVLTPEGPVNLLVDSVGDVASVTEDLFERPPETVHRAARGIIRGAYKLQGRLLLHLDVDQATTLKTAARGPLLGEDTDTGEEN